MSPLARMFCRRSLLLSAARPRAAFGTCPFKNQLPNYAMTALWPHAPRHHFAPHGTCMLTAGTLHKVPLFDSPAKLDLFRDIALELIGAYGLSLDDSMRGRQRRAMKAARGRAALQSALRETWG